MDTVYFHLPDFWGQKNVYQMLFRCMEEEPDSFYPQVRIGSVYGCFPGCIWNGGRISLGSCTTESMRDLLLFYNQKGIPVRYTYTNSLLKQEHLADPYCNQTMHLADNGLNQVVVNSDLLEGYLREKYPRFSFISSTTKCLTDLSRVTQELDSRYFLVVLDYNFNNTSCLKEIPHKERCEILLNAYCYDHCDQRKAHYLAVSECQLQSRACRFRNCKSLTRNFYQLFSNHSFITVEQIWQEYVPAGFRHFKIEGRLNNDFDVLESLMYYLVRPERRDEIRLRFLKFMAEWKFRGANQ